MNNFHYKIYQLERATAYWQTVVFSCEKENYTIIINQYGKGEIPTAGCFLNGGRISVGITSVRDFGSEISKASTAYHKKLKSGKGYQVAFNSDRHTFERLIKDIANGKGEKITQSVRDLVRKSLGGSEQAVEKVEPVVEKQVHTDSSELSWLANYWGATA